MNIIITFFTEKRRFEWHHPPTRRKSRNSYTNKNESLTWLNPPRTVCKIHISGLISIHRVSIISSCLKNCETPKDVPFYSLKSTQVSNTLILISGSRIFMQIHIIKDLLRSTIWKVENCLLNNLNETIFIFHTVETFAHLKFSYSHKDL